MDISFVIVNYNSVDYIKNCIGSILFFLGRSRGKSFSSEYFYARESFLSEDSRMNQDRERNLEHGLECEIIVVDNGSTDGSISYLKELGRQFENIVFIDAGKNIGFSKASNLGAKRAKGSFLLFLNPDTVFVDSNLEDVLKFYQEKSGSEKVGVIGVKIINQDKSLQYSVRSFPTILRQFYESFFLHRIFKKSKIFGSYFLSWWDHRDIKEVDWVSGAFMLIRKDNFEKVGGFDESYFMFSEDCDLCLRLARAGYKNYYFPFFKVIHFDSAIASRNTALREARIWSSRRLYFRKNYSVLHGEIVSFLYFLEVINRIILFFVLSVFKPGRENRLRLLTYLRAVKFYFSGIQEYEQTI